MKFYGKVKGLKMQVFSRAEMENHIVSLEGEDVEIDIKKRNRRSNKLNRLMWAYHTIMSKETGYSKEEWHEIFKMKFCKREKVDERTGEVLEYLKSTTDFSNSETVEILEHYREWCAITFGVVLPDPDEQTNLDV